MSRIDRQKAEPPAKQPQSAPLETSSRQLLGEARELRIEHGGELYCLRVTRNGKLILTK